MFILIFGNLHINYAFMNKQNKNGTCFFVANATFYVFLNTFE